MLIDRLLGDHPAHRRQPTGGGVVDELAERPLRPRIVSLSREVVDLVLGEGRQVRAVALPFDAGRVEAVRETERRNRRRRQRRVLAHHARVPRDADHAVHVSRSEGRAEIAVAERESVGERPVVGEVGARVIDQALALPERDQVGHALHLGVEDPSGRCDPVAGVDLAVRSGVRQGCAVGQSVDAWKEAEVVVEGAVLLHQEDEVLDRGVAGAADPHRREGERRRGSSGARQKQLSAGQHRRLSSAR